jgi:hypothetical protein
MLITLFLSILTSADPSGSPICSAENAKIHTSIQPASVNLGYKLLASPGPNNTFLLTLSGQRPDYQGLLIYSTAPSHPNIHLGGFKLPSPKFRFMDRQVCKSQGILQQQFGTLTHANPTRIPTNTVFTWFPIDNSEIGLDITVHAVIASQDQGQGGKARWEYISVGLKSDLPATTTTDAGASVSASASTSAMGGETTTASTAAASASASAGNVGYPGLMCLIAAVFLI